MLLGLIAGGVLKSDRSNKQKLGWLAAAAVISWGLGIAWHYGQCPIVKKIWTPSWTLFSGGSCLAFLGAFFAIMEMAKWRRWAIPLMVIGANSIVAYCIAHLWHPFLHHNWRVHAGRPFEKYGEHWETICEGAVVFVFMWLFLFWMWRRRIFVKI
jgi:predicted acyltransferase